MDVDFSKLSPEEIREVKEKLRKMKKNRKTQKARKKKLEMRKKLKQQQMAKAVEVYQELNPEGNQIRVNKANNTEKWSQERPFNNNKRKSRDSNVKRKKED